MSVHSESKLCSLLQAVNEEVQEAIKLLQVRTKQEEYQTLNNENDEENLDYKTTKINSAFKMNLFGSNTKSINKTNMFNSKTSNNSNKKKNVFGVDSLRLNSKDLNQKGLSLLCILNQSNLCNEPVAFNQVKVTLDTDKEDENNYSRNCKSSRTSANLTKSKYIEEILELVNNKYEANTNKSRGTFKNCNYTVYFVKDDYGLSSSEETFESMTFPDNQFQESENYTKSSCTVSASTSMEGIIYQMLSNYARFSPSPSCKVQKSGRGFVPKTSTSSNKLSSLEIMCDSLPIECPAVKNRKGFFSKLFNRRSKCSLKTSSQIHLIKQPIPKDCPYCGKHHLSFAKNSCALKSGIIETISKKSSSFIQSVCRTSSKAINTEPTIVISPKSVKSVYKKPLVTISSKSNKSNLKSPLQSTSNFCSYCGKPHYPKAAVDKTRSKKSSSFIQQSARKTSSNVTCAKLSTNSVSEKSLNNAFSSLVCIKPIDVISEKFVNTTPKHSICSMSIKQKLKNPFTSAKRKEKTKTSSKVSFQETPDKSLSSSILKEDVDENPSPKKEAVKKCPKLFCKTPYKKELLKEDLSYDSHLAAETKPTKCKCKEQAQQTSLQSLIKTTREEAVQKPSKLATNIHCVKLKRRHREFPC